MVVTDWPSTIDTGVTQERTACAVDVHRAGAAGAMPQPNLVPVS